MTDAQQPLAALEALANELAQLRATLAAQQDELTTQRATIAQQQATIGQQQAAITALQRGSDADEAPLSDATDATDATDASAADAAPAAPRKTSRRNLLVGAAGVAAAATAAVASVAISEPQVAHAATGDNLILGQANDEGTTTTLTNTAGTNSDGFVVLVPNGQGATAIYGSATWGAAPLTQRKALPATGTGSPFETSGVVGLSDEGVGVTGKSFDFVDLAAIGLGRIFQQPQGQVGAPPAPVPPMQGYSPGESIRDANGDLWLCTGIDASFNPVWVKVAHLAPGATSGGALTYLAKPIRLLDTRAGEPAASPTKGAFAANSTHTLQVAGVTYNGVTTPASCAGAVGNLTIIGGPGTGNYVALVPSGVGFSGTANIAFTAGQVVSNAYNVGLSASGALDIIIGTSGSSGANVILDLFAIVS